MRNGGRSGWREVFRPLGLAALLVVSVLGTTRAGQAGPAPFLDDRSTPEALIASLYNAIDRQEYLRAWSYYAEGEGRPAWDDYPAGFAQTRTVTVKTGAVTSEGAAGSVYSNVPVAIRAETRSETTEVFTGCYVTRFVEPGNQAAPPYVPLQIVKGELSPAKESFETAAGTCADPG
ncbi:hypothetical protein DYI37_12825 [Fulvimarina endophytica]|uniref:DUF1176 domain-containing protein n=1 Tax=Fulvimarina endophytica TaxID=2293836 RepID=A0A371X0U1_9HYPH|nr:hypothetical protein [Fulvimarina endophytica]RFC62839.1 hypothetical protein DYI37_12825 [Fulvimarina endophytica]